MANETCIRDPIHNYINLTEVEAKLVKHPLFQRLRFITQNGSAYYTYPSNRNCRFLHSLGCMKIGGDIFLTSTENLNDSDVNAYLLESFDMIKDICTSSLTTHIDHVVKLFVVRKDKTFIKYGLDLWINHGQVEEALESDYIKIKFARAVLFQSLRLACVLHDIGHFPFSHVLEMAFGKYIDYLDVKSAETNEIFRSLKQNLENVEKQIHENIGLKILDTVIPSTENEFHKLCRNIARIILTEKQDAYTKIISPLHNIVSGEIDADRLDYCLRDPQSSGLELGAFDLERLINSFLLAKSEDSYFILPSVQALSAIESFYHQRFLTYKYLIYHHSKVRMDKIIEEITLLLIDLNFKTSENDVINNIRALLRNNNFDFLWKEFHGKKYYYCNENWYCSLLQNIYLIIQDKHVTDELYKDIFDKLKVLLETFLFRKTENVFSVFKRYDHFYDFFCQIMQNISNSKYDLFQREMRGVVLDSFANKRIEELTRDIYNNHNTICLFAKTLPKVIELDDSDSYSKLKIIQVFSGTKRLVPVSILSPYLQGLLYSSQLEQFFHIFLVKESVKEGRENLEGIKKQIIDFFSARYREVYSK